MYLWFYVWLDLCRIFNYISCLLYTSFDEVIAIGPLIMMKFVCELTKKYNIKTIVSMNPIMIDGTGMCGGCRLSVGGKTKFACVDGPDFDGHEVDFDEAMSRGATSVSYTHLPTLIPATSTIVSAG